MSHPLAAPERRPRLLALVAFTAALLTLLIVPLRADAAAPVIVNGQNAFEGLAFPGETNRSRGGAISVAVRHDRGLSIESVQIDQDYNGSDNFPGTSQDVTSLTQSIVGGATVSMATATYTASTSNLGFDCNLNPFGTPIRNVSKPVRIRAVMSDNSTTAVISRDIGFVASGNCNTRQDYATIFDQSQSPSQTSTIAPGGTVAFTFTGDHVDSDGTFSGIIWRARRLSDGATTSPTTRQLGDSDNTARTLTATFNRRGRWVVEAQALANGDTTPQLSNRWFRLGAINVNTAASTSPTLSLEVPGERLQYGATSTQVTATTADASDTSDGGAVSTIEWDLNSDTTDGVNGFEVGLLGNPLTGAGLGALEITDAQKTRTVNVAGQAPGEYTVRARVTDSGALTSGDRASRTKTASTTYTVDAPPLTATPAPVATDSATPVTVPLTATDADGDTLTWSVGEVTPAEAGTVEVVDGQAVFTPSGTYTGAASFSVTADDGYGGGAAPSATKTATVQIERPGPDTTITATPLPIDPDAQATFEFGSPDAESFECRLDGGTWDDCSSPVTFERLTNGEHTFEVRGIDAEGFVEFFPARHTWTVLDVTAPTATITEEPTSPSNDATPTFAFEADEDGATFACAIDDGEPAPCDSPYTAGELTDGEHTFTVVATDVGGNASLPVSRTFVIDATGPVVEVTGGPEGATNATTAEFTFTSEDDARFTCRLDDGHWTSCTSPYTAEDLADGEHTFAVKALDALDNEGGETTRTFTVDTVVPEAPGVSVAAPRTTDTTPEVTLTHADGGDGVTFEASVDGGDWVAVEATFETGELTDGEHAIHARSIDAAGNAGAAGETTVEVDTTAPVTEITDGPAGPTNDPTPTFEFTTDDDDASVEASVDGGEWEPAESPLTLAELDEGEHTLALRATDALGNQEDPAVTRTFTFDVTAPAAPTVTGPEGPTNDTTPEISAAHADEDGVAFEASIDGDEEWTTVQSPFSTPELTDGSHTVAVRSVDAAGNAGEAGTVTVTVDTTGAVAEITEGPGGPTADSTPEFAFSSEEGATFEVQVDDGEWRGDAVSPLVLDELEDGEHTFSVRATDALGNTGEAVSRTFTVDTTGPVVEITDGPADPTNDPTPEFAFESENGATFEVQVDDGEWRSDATSPVELEELEDGDHTFSVRATDTLGNEGSAVSRTFVVDTAAPAAPALTAPSDRIADSTPEITFTHAVDTGDGATFEVKIDDGEWEAAQSPLTLDELSDGEHTVRVRSVDAAGNPGAQTPSTFTVDTAGAVAEITEGPDGPTADSTPEFAFSSEEGATFEVQVDDGEWRGDVTSPVVLEELEDGDHTFSVRATDTVGNTGEAVSRTFTVDTTGAVAQITGGPEGRTAESTPDFTFSSEEGATFEVQVDDGEWRGDVTSPVVLEELEDGEHTFSVRATDALGNTGAAASRTFTVDTTAPGTVIDGGPTGTMTTAVARFTFASADADVAGFECRIDGGAFAACTSPYTSGVLADGEHVFEVRAVDALGNVESSAVRRAFTVATPAPPVQQPPVQEPPVQQPPVQHPPVQQPPVQQQPPVTTAPSRSTLLSKVALSRTTLTRTRSKAVLRYTLGERSRVVVRIEQKIVRGGKTRYRTVRRMVRTGAPGNRTLTFGLTENRRTLAKGTYRVSVVARGASKRTKTTRLTLKVA